MSECVHLNKTDRDAVTWAVQNLSPEKPETETSFGGWDFSEWPTVPDRRIFEDLIKSRRAKRGCIMTQTYIDTIAPHLHTLSKNGLTVNESLAPAVVGGWTGFNPEHVMTEISKQEQDQSIGINTEAEVLNLLKQHQLTSIDQIPSSIKKEMKDKYLYRHYGPQTMIQLKNIGF
jgi:hypothetical protein